MKCHWLLGLLCGLLLTVTATAADKIEITPAEVTVSTTEYQVFRIAWTAEMKSLKWINLDPSIKLLAGAGITIDPGYAYFRFTQKGTFWLTAVAVTDKFEIVEQRIKVTAVSESETVVDPPIIVPKKDPAPKKDPVIIPPAVTKGKIAVMVALEETADASNTRQTFIDSPEVQALIKDIIPYSFDRDLSKATFRDPEVKKKVADLVKNTKSFPWLYLMAASGEILYSGPSPSTARELAALLTKHGSN